MRTAVGPLPAAVYWRRRAVVLGALLVGVLVLFLSCSGEDEANPRGTGADKPLPGAGAGQTSPTPDIEPSFEDVPPGGADLPDPSEVIAGQGDEPATGASTGPDVAAAVPTGRCTDDEVSVTPVPARIAVKRGTPIELRLKIKNISTGACTRDVGADLQEIYVKQGARKVWSSDICGLAKGSQILNFAPNHEREYNVTWNGRAATKCAGGSAAGLFPLAGEYQLFGRLGGKVSAPVRLVITA